MKKRGNFLILLFLLAASVCLGARPRAVSGLVVLFLALTALWLYLAYRGSPKAAWAFWLIMALGLFLVGQMAGLTAINWEEGEYAGSVYSVEMLSFDQRVLIRLFGSNLPIAVHLPQAAEVKAGDELRFTGSVSLPPSALNPGMFCYRTYLKRAGVFALCYPEHYSVLPCGKQNLLAKGKERLRSNLSKHVQDPSLSLALVLGERGALSEKRKNDWRLLGISHLLAISGMHVGFIALGLSFAVRRLRLRPLCRLLVSQAALLIYILVAGSSISAWRAYFFSFFGGLAAHRGLRPDPLRIWAIAAWLLILIEPALIFQPGFVLSFAASGGILLWGPALKIKSGWKVLDYAANSLLISMAAQLSLMPFLLHYFGEIALLGPLSTLLFLPLVAVLLAAGWAAALGLGWLGGPLINWIMVLVQALENFLVRFSLQWSPEAFALYEVSLWWALFLYGGWRLRRPRLTKPRRTYAHLALSAALVLLITTLPAPVRRPLEVTAVNVGQGDCYHIRTPSGRNLLIDGGGDSLYWQARGRNVGEERLVPYLQHRKVSRVDYVILSHPHEDHLFGLLAVLENFEVGMVIDNGHSHTSLTYARYLELIDEKKIPYWQAKAGDRFNLGDGISLDILYPDRVRPRIVSAYNNNSLLVKLSYGGMDMLFTGDLERASLYDLVHNPQIDLKAQWLKIPHHGSEGSLLEEFYLAVDPQWAVISVGPNAFGHPHREVLETLSRLGIRWRSTEKNEVTFWVWWGLFGRFKGVAP